MKQLNTYENNFHDAKHVAQADLDLYKFTKSVYLINKMRGTEDENLTGEPFFLAQSTIMLVFLCMIEENKIVQLYKR